MHRISSDKSYASSQCVCIMLEAVLLRGVAWQRGRGIDRRRNSLRRTGYTGSINDVIISAARNGADAHLVFIHLTSVFTAYKQ